MISALAACAGCSSLRALHHAAELCVSVPAPTGDPGIVRFGIIPTRRAPKPVPYAIVLPRGVEPRRIERVVYVAPGRGGTAEDVVGAMGYASAAQHIIAAGAPAFALIAMDSGESYYHPRTSGEDRLGILEIDLPALLRTIIAPHLAREALIGQSMGGYGALLAAERNPTRYRAVAVAAPAIFQTFAEEDHAVGDAFDDATQFAEYDVLAHAHRLAHTPVLVRVGYNDPFLRSAGAFAAACPHADVGYVENGCHDDGFWRATASELLTFAVSTRVEKIPA